MIYCVNWKMIQTCESYYYHIIDIMFQIPFADAANTVSNKKGSLLVV